MNRRATIRLMCAGLLSLTGVLMTGAVKVVADDDPFSMHAEPPIVGRWDLTVHGIEGEHPAWFEVRQSGFRTLVGAYVGQFGSSRPIAVVQFKDDEFQFSLPPQWERRVEDIQVRGRIEGDQLSGELTDEQGRMVKFSGVRSPDLVPGSESEFLEPITLFNGENLQGWQTRFADRDNGWEVRDGILVNARPGNDLMTVKKFDDFRLLVEFRYPSGSNSGIYLRGRHEVQIEDNFGKPADSHRIGGVYGFLTPSLNASKPAGEWQTIEITLRGREVTVVLNDEQVIDRQLIPGITGGALDSQEGEPGPVLLQGDHGPVEFRKVILTPIAESAARQGLGI